MSKRLFLINFEVQGFMKDFSSSCFSDFDLHKPNEGLSPYNCVKRKRVHFIHSWLQCFQRR